MQAWVVERFGGLDDLVLKEIARPSAARDVLVRVMNAALNFADGIALRGHYQRRIEPPFVLGSELAGVVVEARPDSGFIPGDRVMAQVPSGAFAEYCLVDPDRLVRIPPTMDFVQGVALPVSFTTAYIALITKARMQSDETILIHAAAGGAGLAAVQIARWSGAHVIATAGSAEKCALVAANGADHVINYRKEDWGERVNALAPAGVDIVFDPVGGDITLQSLKLLRWEGRLLLVGFAGGDIPSIPANRLLIKSATAHGIFWDWEKEAAKISHIQSKLIDLCLERILRPHIGGKFPLGQLKAAMELLEGRQTAGKIILDLSHQCA